MTQSQSSKPNEYDTFKDFARRLVAVPKSEADEVKQKEPAKRTKKQTEKRESVTLIRVFTHQRKMTF